MTPTEKKKARRIIRRYLERSEAVRAGIHYSQARPMTHLGVSPEQGYTADCSGYVTGAFKWADKWLPFHVKDPNGRPAGSHYDGWGYTGTLLAANARRRVPLNRRFFLGDIALYGPSLSRTGHCTICRQGGDAATSVWSSHGNEAGPYPTRLHYRRDLLVVVRAEALA